MIEETISLDQISDSIKNFCKNSVSLHGFSFSSPAMNEIKFNHWFSLTRGKKVQVSVAYVLEETDWLLLYVGKPQ